MKNKRQNRLLAGLFLLSFLIVFTSGCDKYTRQEVLTLFFTGVPHPDEEKVAEVQVVKKIKGRPIPEVKYFIHGPYAAKQCYHCHEMSTTFGSKKTGKKEIGRLPKLEAGGQIPGMLVIPIKDLCLECHPPKPAHWSDMAPLSEGNCVSCHDPHQSPLRYMLRKKI